MVIDRVETVACSPIAIARRRLTAPILSILLICALVACSDETADDAAAPAGQTAPSAADTASPAEVPAADATDDRVSADSDIPAPAFPRGLITNTSEATPGYVLFNPLLSDTAYLVNNAGEVVHTWQSAYSPGGGMYMLENGNLLRTGRDPERLGFPAGGTGGILQEFDWDGNVVWEWRFSDENQVQHHDIEPLPNGNVLVLAWEVKSKEDAARAGRRPDRIPDQGIWPEWIFEIEPVRPNGAKRIWEWHVWDHLVQDYDPQAAHYGVVAEHPQRLDINADSDSPDIGANQLAQLQALGYVPDDATSEDLASDFLHANAIDYHARLDQIAISVPALGEIWIIDHAPTTAEARGSRGDLLYRWGNPAVYGRSDTDGKRFFYQHDVRWIPDGWEGAGNLMVFNNGDGRPTGSYSSIDEWTPPLQADGSYAIGERNPFAPTTFDWRYIAPEAGDFFSPFISGAHRLANGNTMICSGVDGRLFEITRGGEIVWEYRNPFSGDVRNADGSLPQPGLDERPYAVYRATRIPADHAGLAGRNLKPLDPQPAWFDYEARTGGDS